MSGAQAADPELAQRMWRNPGEICGNTVVDDANGFVDDCNGWDFGYNDNDPQPDVVRCGWTGGRANDHATRTGRIIAGQRDNLDYSGTGEAANGVGLAYNAKLMNLKVSYGIVRRQRNAAHHQWLVPVAKARSGLFSAPPRPP